MRSLMADIGSETSIMMGIDAGGHNGSCAKEWSWSSQTLGGAVSVDSGKGPECENTADLMIKFLASDQIHAALTSMGIWFADGRADIVSWCDERDLTARRCSLTHFD